ncbi:DUF3368 domain-containing protein [soil metagenome]
MPNAVISDASCLIILTEIGSASLLRAVFGSVITTPEIAAEVGFDLPNWIEIVSPTDLRILDQMPTSIDHGEATAIALALEMVGSTLIIDDLSARNYAIRLGMQVTGTLGVLINAKLDGHIVSIKPYIEKIRNTNFRFSKTAERTAYVLANEVDF